MADQSDDHGRIPFEQRHPRIQQGLDAVTARWTRMQQSEAVRVLGTFAILFAQRRAFGFSAEAAFWATFTLPWLLLGGVSAVSNVAVAAGENRDADIEALVLDAASSVLTPQTVEAYVEPLLDEVVAGSTGITIIGFLVAVWSGSRVFATFVEGSTVINGSPKRNYLETRGLALAIYGLGLLSLAALVFSILKWTDAWKTALGILPGGISFWFVLVGFGLSALAATTMMYLANPRRTNWRYALPGGILGLLIWLGGSWGLQIYITWLLRDGTLYAAIAAPIAVMLWIFVATLAMFVGITLNAATLLFLDVRNRNLASLEHRAESDMITGARLIQMAEHPDEESPVQDAESVPDGVNESDSRGESDSREFALKDVTSSVSDQERRERAVEGPGRS
jgi:membrane protein